MSNALTIIRSLVIYSLCLPLAIFLGYQLAMPFDSFNFTVVVVVVFLPLVPFLLKWHHLLLFGCWNTSIALFFLPGRPNLWLVMAAVSFTLAILQHILNRNLRFISVPSVTRPLLFLAVVVVITAKLTGGFGMRTMGGESIGGKRYIMLLGAVVGYFGMTFFRVPEGKGFTYVAMYFLGTLTGIIGSLAPFVDRSFYPIFALFPVENLGVVMGDGSQVESGAWRLGGVTFAATALICFIFARHGVRALTNLGERWSFLPWRVRGGLSFNQPWRLLIFLAMIWISLMGGYRSTAIILGLAFVMQFYLEGLFRSHLMPALLLGGILALAVTVPLIHKMPITIQRSLSFLPVEVDPMARVAAEASNEWRMRIWRTVLPLVPQYLILGKGYAINPSELIMANDNQGRSGGNDSEASILSGDYHNGPLSLIIPLGIFGVIGFIWFLYAAFKVLLNNYHFGDPAMRTVNIFLLSYFVARLFYFLFIFGAFHGELAIFVGVVGLSVSLNGGVCKPAPAPVEKPGFAQLKLARAARQSTPA